MRNIDATDLIRRRAYQIWECEGPPHGRHVVHWLLAESEIRELSNIAQEPVPPVKRGEKTTRKTAPASKSASKSSRRQTSRA